MSWDLHYLCDEMWLFLYLVCWWGLPQLCWYSRKTEVIAFRLDPCVTFCVIIQQPEWKTLISPSLNYRQMTHIHTWMKKETVLFPAIPFCHLSGSLPSEHLCSRFFFFLYSISEKKWCCFTTAVAFYFLMNTFFLSQTLSVSPGNLHLPNSRWHLKYTVAPVSYCFPRPSLTTVIKCGFPSFTEPHIQKYVLLFHMYTRKRHTSNGSSSISLCLDRTGPLPPTRTPPSANTLQSGAAHWDKTSGRMSSGASLSKFCSSLLSLLFSFAQKGMVIK